MDKFSNICMRMNIISRYKWHSFNRWLDNNALIIFAVIALLITIGLIIGGTVSNSRALTDDELNIHEGVCHGREQFLRCDTIKDDKDSTVIKYTMIITVEK